jgi:hypothetical protein
MCGMSEARPQRLATVDAPPARDDQRLDLRASDADRDRVAAHLGGALAVGRLTSAEYADRLDAVYTARTLGDLAPLTRDLPDSDAVTEPLSTAGSTAVTARFSKVIRSGRWVAGRHTRLTVHFGALIINLADAVLPGREVTDLRLESPQRGGDQRAHPLGQRSPGAPSPGSASASCSSVTPRRCPPTRRWPSSARRSARASTTWTPPSSTAPAMT